MAKQRYDVLSPIKFNKKRYEPGATLDLDDDVAAPLLEVKAVKAPEKKGEDKK